MTTALLDGDILAYRAASVAEQDDDFGEGKVLNPAAARKAADWLVRSWTERAQCDAALVCFTSKPVFRDQILPSYKRNRTGQKPALYDDVVAHLRAKRTIREKPGLEADDVIGVIATGSPGFVAVSVDKDFATLPCRIFNPDKDAIPRKISLRSADKAWMTQALVGDTIDGYKGLPGCGPVGAAAALDGCRDLGEMWEAVVAAYEAKGLTEEDALVQARVARILRNTDFDTKTREVIAWAPRPSLSARIPTTVETTTPSAGGSETVETGTSSRSRKSSTSRRRGRQPKTSVAA